MEKEIEEVERVVRRNRIGRSGRVFFEVGLEFGFLSGEPEFEIVVDVDLEVDLFGRRLLGFGLRVDFARERAPDEA